MSGMTEVLFCFRVARFLNSVGCDEGNVAEKYRSSNSISRKILVSDNWFPLPMFPLQSVLFPGVAIPLHIFEPRYKKLIEDLSKGPPTFGVVMISRGSEVGGGDQRSFIGTAARLAEKVLLDDGQWVILAVGEYKVKVQSWLPDDPYPVALVEIVDFHEVLDEYMTSFIEKLKKKLRYAMLLKDEVSVGVSSSVFLSFSNDPSQAMWQMCAVAPIAILDQQKLLEVDHLRERVQMFDRFLDDAISLFEGQLSIK